MLTNKSTNGGKNAAVPKVFAIYPPHTYRTKVEVEARVELAVFSPQSRGRHAYDDGAGRLHYLNR